MLSFGGATWEAQGGEINPCKCSTSSTLVNFDMPMGVADQYQAVLTFLHPSNVNPLSCVQGGCSQSQAKGGLHPGQVGLDIPDLFYFTHCYAWELYCFVKQMNDCLTLFKS